MNCPLVSIIVPVYNAAPFLDELCASIRAQTHAHFEALFLDDGSTDGSWAALEKHRADERFQIFSWRENRGVTAATAELLRKMKGAYWCNPGADDVLEPQFIERRIEVAAAHPNAAIVHGPGHNIDPQGQPLPASGLPRPIPQVLECDRALRVLLEHNVINTPGVMVNSGVTRAVLDKFHGPWRFAQDWFLWFLHIATGRQLVWHEERLHRYRIHPSSLTQNAANLANRTAETRLVPLCALSEARTFSPCAASIWAEWRETLYALWLRRALNLARQKALRGEWLSAGQRAYYGRETARPLAWELARHGWRIAIDTLRESRARQRNRFRVSGLALVDDPLFR